MSTAAAPSPPDSARTYLRRGFQFHLIPRIDTFPAVVKFGQTIWGKLVMLLVFWGGAWVLLPHDFVTPFVGLIALTTFLPKYRRIILAISPFALLLNEVLDSHTLLAMYAAVVSGGILLFWIARRWPKSTFAQRPIVFLLTGFSLLILGASISHSKATWTLVGVSATFVWFIGYALMDRTASLRRDGSLELASLHPLWGSSTTPYPKGAAYLRRIEARTPEQLAVAQLKGLKLLAWAILLSFVLNYWTQFFHQYLNIPIGTQAISMSSVGHPFAWHLRWESQILGFFENALKLTIYGHGIIACCRMAGFNALRNTCRPLSATTVADFFNRYFYYFKELLVDFFFFPAFLRYWKGHRRLRLVFANFAAAGFGNAFFHFTRDWQVIQEAGPSSRPGKLSGVPVLLRRVGHGPKRLAAAKARP